MCCNVLGHPPLHSFSQFVRVRCTELAELLVHCVRTTALLCTVWLPDVVLGSSFCEA